MTDGAKGIKKYTTGEEAIEVGRDEATITTRTQEDSIEIQGRQSTEVTKLLPTILKIDEIRLTTEADPRVSVALEMTQNTSLHNTQSNQHHQVAAMMLNNLM